MPLATTQPTAMTREHMTAWLRLRGVQETELDQMLTQYAGRTEDEMDELYDRQHGHIA